MVDVRDVARAAVAVLAGKGHEGKAYELTGPEALSLHDVADRIGAVLRQQVLYVDQPPAKVISALLGNEVPGVAGQGSRRSIRVSGVRGKWLRSAGTLPR